MIRLMWILGILSLAPLLHQEALELTFYSEKPITQLLSSDSETMTVILGTKSFSYSKKAFDLSPNALNGSPFLFTSSSVTIKRLTDGTIAIGCNEIGFTILTENGDEVCRYNNNIFNKDTKCSLLQLSHNRFVFSYKLNSAYIVEFLSYDRLNRSLTQEDRSFSFPASQKGLIQCESYLTKQIVLCIYQNKQLEGSYFSYDYSIIKHFTIEGNEKKQFKFVKVNDTFMALFSLSELMIHGILFKYNEIQQKIETDRKGNLMQLGEMGYEVFDIHVVKTDLFMNAAIIIIVCKKAKCLLEKFSVDFVELIPRVEIHIPFSNNTMAIALSAFNEYDLSIVLTANSRNYLIQYNINTCLNATTVYEGTNTVSFDDYSNHNSSHAIDIMIVSCSTNMLNYLTLDTKRSTIEENLMYSLSRLRFTPAKSGTYILKYQLFYNNALLSPICQMKFNICVKGCKTCSAYGTEDDMNCIDCEDGYYSSYDKPNQCFEEKTIVCLDKEPYWIEREKKCVVSCDLYSMYTDNDEHICVSECQKGKKLNKITNECLCVENFNRNMDKYIKDMDRYVVDLFHYFPRHRKDNFTINIYDTSTLPAKYSIEFANFDSNNITSLSTVYLNQCEQKLKTEYGFNATQPLLIAKFDYRLNSQITHNVNYSVYSLEGAPLNMSLCDESNITIVTPIINTTNDNISLARNFSYRNIDLFNSADPFFNDICYPYTTDYQTDIPLSLRLKEFYLNNEQLCNPGCEAVFLDYDSMFAVCSCSKGIKPVYTNNYSLLLNQSHTFIRQSNLEIVKCYRLIFKDNLILNFGNFFVICLIVIQAINSLYFAINGMKAIETSMLSKIKCSNWTSRNQKKLQQSGKGLNLKRNSIFNQSSSDSIESSGNKKEHPNQTNNNISNIVLIQSHLGPNFSSLKAKQRECLSHDYNANDTLHPRFNIVKCKACGPKVIKSFKESNSIENSKNLKQIEELKKPNVVLESVPNVSAIYQRHKGLRLAQADVIPRIYSLNNLLELPFVSLNPQLIGFEFFYWSFFHFLQPIIRTFFLRNVFNTRIIRVSLFIFYIILTITLNTLLFSEKYCIQSYLTHGHINFVFNLPIVFYSFCAGLGFRLFFNSLSLPMAVIDMLKAKQAEFTKEQKLQLIKKMKYRMIASYIIQLVLSVLCWYYVSVFCAVYPNLQLTLILSCLLCFILEQVFPLVLSAILAVQSVISQRYHLKLMKHFTHVMSMMS